MLDRLRERSSLSHALAEESFHTNRTAMNLIRDHIATKEVDYAPSSKGEGLGKAHEVFGKHLPKLLEELNVVLVG